MTEAIFQEPSAQTDATSIESNATNNAGCESQDLRIGDIVRSNELHWRKTGQHLSGSIVRFESVPESQIQAVGGAEWAYLNTGEGPISAEVLEKVPSFPSQLERLQGALENRHQEFETKKLVGPR